eukprot:6214301-Pleurochrysis_carterae.AAC.1
MSTASSFSPVNHTHQPYTMHRDDKQTHSGSRTIVSRLALPALGLYRLHKSILCAQIVARAERERATFLRRQAPHQELQSSYRPLTNRPLWTATTAASSRHPLKAMLEIAPLSSRASRALAITPSVESTAALAITPSEERASSTLVSIASIMGRPS